MNQLSWIIEKGRNKLELNTRSLESEQNVSTAEASPDEKNGKFKQIKEQIQKRNVHSAVDVFEKLKLDLVKDKEGENIPNYIGMKKQDTSFNLKEWEKYITAEYAAQITRSRKGMSVRRKYHAKDPVNENTYLSVTKLLKGISDHETLVIDNQTENNGNIKEPDSVDDQRLSKGKEPVSLLHQNSMKSIQANKVRPISANGSRPMKHRLFKRKRIKSAGHCQPNHGHMDSSKSLNSNEELQSVHLRIPAEFQKNAGVDEIYQSSNASSEQPDMADGQPKPLETQYEDEPLSSVTLLEADEPLSSVTLPEAESTNHDPSSQSLPSTPKKSCLKSSPNSEQAVIKCGPPKREQPKRPKIQVVKKKKVLTKIKELAELYEEVLSSSEDELDDDSNEMTARMSQWRKDLMREAPPGIYSVNTPIKIHLAVSKSQLQKDLGRLVDEHSSNLRHLNDREHERRLQSRMNVYMTMKMVEKAVCYNKTK